MMEELEDFIYEPPSPSPPIYRFCEMLCVFGETLKELIQEQDSDKFFRAIDLHISVAKVPDETGDYFEINLLGKLHPE